MSEGPPPGIGGIARRLGKRVKDAVAPSDVSAKASSERSPQAQPEQPASAPSTGRRAKAAARKAELRAAADQVDQLTHHRDELRQKRRELQVTLGAAKGKKLLPRLKVEKTNGTPSFVVSQRMMQRIYGQAPDRTTGLDGVDGVFADLAETAHFAGSHGVPVVDAWDETADVPVIAHSFKGNVPLVEVRSADAVRHFRADGSDPGDIRPAATHDAEIAQPEGFEDICAWSKTLSRNIPRPYVQVFWTITAQGPRLHHVDIDPDRIPVLTPEWDKRLGQAFDGAYTRYLKQPLRRGGLDNRVPGGTFTPEEIV